MYSSSTKNHNGLACLLDEWILHLSALYVPMCCWWCSAGHSIWNIHQRCDPPGCFYGRWQRLWEVQPRARSFGYWRHSPEGNSETPLLLVLYSHHETLPCHKLKSIGLWWTMSLLDLLTEQSEGIFTGSPKAATLMRLPVSRLLFGCFSCCRVRAYLERGETTKQLLHWEVSSHPRKWLRLPCGCIKLLF